MAVGDGEGSSGARARVCVCVPYFPDYEPLVVFFFFNSALNL